MTDRKKRAELLDEALEIITGLWHGQPFSFKGKHYQIKPTKFYLPSPPVQQPRIPIWVVGAWPHMKSMQRVLKYDGLLPAKMVDKKHVEVKPEDLREMNEFIEANRTETTPFDIIVEGQTPSDDSVKATEIIRPWVKAGATWWIEAMWGDSDVEHIRTRLQHPPPRI